MLTNKEIEKIRITTANHLGVAPDDIEVTITQGGNHKFEYIPKKTTHWRPSPDYPNFGEENV